MEILKKIMLNFTGLAKVIRCVWIQQNKHLKKTSWTYFQKINTNDFVTVLLHDKNVGLGNLK